MDADALKREREAETEVLFLDPADQVRLVECQPPSVRDVVLVALHTGLRRSEILRLEWAEVDFRRRLVRVRESKNSQPREVPMTGPVCECLRDLADQRGARKLRGPDRVFTQWPAPEQETAEDRRRLLKAFRTGCRMAGLPEATRFHDLRHSFGSSLARAGVPIPDIGRLMGHRSRVMSLRYACHAPANSAQTAVARLQSYLTGEGGTERNRRGIGGSSGG